MSLTIQQCKDNLTAMLHGGSLDKVRSFDLMFERAANTMLLKIDPIDTERIVPLSSTIYDDIYNYALPSDYKKIIDLYPQANRQTGDTATRIFAGQFDVQKQIADKKITIESNNGTKVLRVDWSTRAPKVLNSMNSLTANGTWSAVGTATGVALDTIIYSAGNGSIKFDSAVSGDGIQNTDMSAVDMTDEDEVAGCFVDFYIKDATDLAKVTSGSVIWGNDLTTNYWTGVAQTQQSDGTAFGIGWNTIKIPWSTATETGTVAPATIDSAKVTFVTTGAISDIRVDNIRFAIGKSFDIKYYSKYVLKNSAGTWIARTTTNDDTVVLDNLAIQIYLLECLIASAHQVEGADSGFDINWAKAELDTLYRRYKVEYPSMAKKAISYYGSPPDRGRFSRNYGGGLNNR